MAYASWPQVPQPQNPLQVVLVQRALGLCGRLPRLHQLSLIAPEWYCSGWHFHLVQPSFMQHAAGPLLLLNGWLAVCAAVLAYTLIWEFCQNFCIGFLFHFSPPSAAWDDLAGACGRAGWLMRAISFLVRHVSPACSRPVRLCILSSVRLLLLWRWFTSWILQQDGRINGLMASV